MTAVSNRPEGASVDRIAHIPLIDRHGATREQVARAVRKNVEDGRRMAIFYQAPANIRGTSFLVFDYSAASRTISGCICRHCGRYGAFRVSAGRLLLRDGSDIR